TAVSGCLVSGALGSPAVDDNAMVGSGTGNHASSAVHSPRGSAGLLRRSNRDREPFDRCTAAMAFDPSRRYLEVAAFSKGYRLSASALGAANVNFKCGCDDLHAH